MRELFSKKARLIGAAMIGASSAVISSAWAADLAAPVYKAPPAVLAAYSWTGFYIGGNAGYAWMDSTDNITATNAAGLSFTSQSFIATSLPVNPKGFIGGGQAGYNWQINPTWVLGFETDFSGANVLGTLSLPGPADSSRIMTANEKLDWLGTVRARLGYTPWDRTLVYATGGFAYGHASLSTALTRPGVGSPTGCGGLNNCQSGSISAINAGWTAGGGVEWVFAKNWSLKGEYLFYDLGSISHGMADPFFPAAYNASAGVKGSIARAGLNYTF
jgi:outer membrane immunogenic protein